MRPLPPEQKETQHSKHPSDHPFHSKQKTNNNQHQNKQKPKTKSNNNQKAKPKKAWNSFPFCSSFQVTLVSVHQVDHWPSKSAPQSQSVQPGGVTRCHRWSARFTDAYKKSMIEIMEWKRGSMFWCLWMRIENLHIIHIEFGACLESDFGEYWASLSIRNVIWSFTVAPRTNDGWKIIGTFWDRSLPNISITNCDGKGNHILFLVTQYCMHIIWCAW